MEALRKCEERALAGQLALEVMHELKNPLDALGHLNHLALEQADDPAEVRRYLSLAGEQMATVERVASHPLNFAKTTTTPKRVEMAVLADSALRIHQRAIQSRKIHLVLDCPQGITAHVYAGEILQVLSNLIANALDALPDEGTIGLRLRKRSGQVHLLIADNGCGIPAKQSDSVFRPFFSTKQEHGTGLGLSLCKKIVEHHNGKIRLRSNVHPARHGTAFRISLPD